MMSLFLWLPGLAFAAHALEEFVWPGGFADWHRHYPPGSLARVSARFLVLINLAFAVLTLLPALIGAGVYGYAWWMVAAGVQAANGVFHLRAAWRTRAYAPGSVTSAVLYLPLALGGGGYLVATGRATLLTAIQAVLGGVLYHWWSARKHARAILPMADPAAIVL